MPAPTQYSESQFREYLFGVLDEVGTVLGWDPGSPAVTEALNDTLLEFGVSDITTVITPRHLLGLRALGRRAIWRAVVQAVSAKYDFSDSDAKFTRSQIQELALESLKLAENDCLQFSPTYAATLVKVSRPQDPYIVLEDSQRIS